MNTIKVDKTMLAIIRQYGFLNRGLVRTAFGNRALVIEPQRPCARDKYLALANVLKSAGFTGKLKCNSGIPTSLVVNLEPPAE